jgi:hypothetical protein
MSSSLTPAQRDIFDRRGVLRLPDMLPADALAAAQAAVTARLALAGLWADGDWRLEGRARPVWPASGIKAAKVIGNRHPDLAALFETPTLAAMVGELMQGRAVDRSIYRRPQVLCTLPNADAWMLPPGWHTDAPRLASGRLPGVQAFALLSEVAPRGGGTLVIAGSHRLLNDGELVLPRDLHRRLGAEPFFRDYWKKTPVPWADERPLPKGMVGDVPVEVVELAGAPGDVWLMDLRVLHTAAPNAGARPRLMVTSRFVARDVAGEIAEGYGWTTPERQASP